MNKLNKMFYFVFGNSGKSFIDSAIGIDELSKIFKKSRRNMLRSLNNYKKKDSYLLLNGDRVIIIDEEDLRRGVK